MYDLLLDAVLTRPPAFAPMEHALWDDPHISGHMLEAHLDPDRDAASRKHAFIRESAAWIASLGKGGDLLDLGCGPGLYAELFDDAGFVVTGIDLSSRSIAHATGSAKAKGKEIRYRRLNYLGISYENAFDAVTLIYCDFGVLPPSARLRLLRKVWRALRPGGIFVTDVWSERKFERFAQRQTITQARGGFWSPDPYLCVERNIRYEPALMLSAYHVVTAKSLRTYYLWDQAFAQAGLEREMHTAGFPSVSFYADVCGHACGGEDDVLCAVARKE